VESFVTVVANEAISAETAGEEIIIVNLVDKKILVFWEIIGEIRINLINNGGRMEIRQAEIVVGIRGDSTKTTTPTVEISIEKEVNRTSE
jgi:hypothetical protein